MANTAEAMNEARNADGPPLRAVEPRETVNKKWAQFRAVLNQHRREKLLLILTRLHVDR